MELKGNGGLPSAGQPTPLAPHFFDAFVTAGTAVALPATASLLHGGGPTSEDTHAMVMHGCVAVRGRGRFPPQVGVSMLPSTHGGHPIGAPRAPRRGARTLEGTPRRITPSGRWVPRPKGAWRPEGALHVSMCSH